MKETGKGDRKSERNQGVERSEKERKRRRREVGKAGREGEKE